MNAVCTHCVLYQVNDFPYRQMIVVKATKNYFRFEDRYGDKTSLRPSYLYIGCSYAF